MRGTARRRRLQAHRQAFDLFIGHFGTYAVFSQRDHAAQYESYTLLLQKGIDASASAKPMRTLISTRRTSV